MDKCENKRESVEISFTKSSAAIHINCTSRELIKMLGTGFLTMVKSIEESYREHYTENQIVEIIDTFIALSLAKIDGELPPGS